MSFRQLEYDIVIVGSGAGGGTVAKELAPLAKKGARIALLDWGGRFDPSLHHSRNEVDMAMKYYFDMGGYQTVSQDLTLAFAKAVGGSTNVYTGTSLRIPETVLTKWAIPGLAREDLDPRFEKYEIENNVHLTPENDLNDNNKLFRQACAALNWRVEQFPVNTKNCVGLGTCNLGCAIGAKQGTAAVQIPLAERAGVEVIPWCRVDKISSYGVYATIEEARPGFERGHHVPGPYRILAKKIILAAGAVYSPLLLMRSGIKSPALGRYFTCHPALILVGKHPQPISNIQGHPKSFYCDQHMEKDCVLLESCMYFPFTLAKNLTGYGEEMDDLVRHFTHLQMILVLAIDEAEKSNRVTWGRDGRPKIHYRISQKTKESLIAGVKASSRLFFAAGAQQVHAPGASRFYLSRNEVNRLDHLISKKNFRLGQVSIAAAHLMGGCRMGVDPKRSVTDPWGRVHGQRNLYVADASLFPAASEINPYLTIMALADRVAQAVRSDLGEKQ
ncbi:MAG: GMC family oxidoreductase [Bdellovibrionaceae bacterium]|nr:GMC family oxidoreductase [Bdellovibrionales bacterium]MCB9083471.1 GMC family oxidoreductase [Pseudobdellovibrionaceae bacterium]